ncbi:uncharacterized protein [Rutidosis leptorrhynchoides]|uniref:uncharacterized protein n=1 Tax=Rutidosis leptorrhynchoides TaxID=125765 RepID=UPI003A99F17E
MKNLADSRCTDRTLTVGSWAYVKLQPHRQVTLRAGKYNKLSPKYYGPFQVCERVGQVAYKLVLPEMAQIHPVFHISQLREHKGPTPVTRGSIPRLNDSGLIEPAPLKILERKLKKLHNRSAVYGLVQWQIGNLEDVTWESLDELMIRFPDFDVFATHS